MGRRRASIPPGRPRTWLAGKGSVFLRAGNLASPGCVPARMSNSLRLVAVPLALALGVAACGGAASTPGSTSSPGASPGASPTSSPSGDGLAHPTGSDEIVLRFDESGGFVPPEFLAAHVPYFTLYGDGRVVFVSTSTVVQPTPDNVSVGPPIRTATLSEDQIQSLLAMALGDGGLAVARAEYQNPLVADAPTAVFEINVDGGSKTVSVVALGMEGEPGPDSMTLAKLAALRERLRDFDQGGALAASPYVPTAYRGVLLEAAGVQGVPIRDWPWEDLSPADFPLPGDPNVLQQRKRVLTPEQVEALGVTGYESGIQSGIWLRGPDGKLYSLAVRPLLPDESE